MKMQDDRTQDQKRTHAVIVMGTDSFMSGWGEATGGKSYAGWACKPDDIYSVERWVRRRGDQKRVRIVDGNYKAPSGPGHVQIYVVHENHNALKG